MKPRLIVPMTGISSRFTAAGYDRPKFLLEAEGQTVLEHVIDMYPGWDDPVFICNSLHLDNPDLHLEDLIRSKRPGATIVRSVDNSKGPGWAVHQARHLIEPDRAVVVNYCDFTCYWDADDFAAHLTSGEVDGSIPAYTGFHPHMAFSTSYAYPRMQDGMAVDIQEKQPWTDEPDKEYASSGTYGFATGRILLDALDAQIEQNLVLKDEFYLSLTYKPMMAKGARVSVYPLQHFMQWGTPQDFEEYRDVSRALKGWLRPRAGQGEATALDGVARVVLASGAGSRFAREGYALPKPALPLSGRSLLEHSLDSLPGSRSVVVTRRDLGDDGTVTRVAESYGAETVMLSQLSRGQAESALFGLKALDPDLAVTVTACDAISVVDTHTVVDLFEEVGPEGMVVWVAQPYHLAHRRPEQYGWAVASADGQVQQTYLKRTPESTDAGVIVGTFGFGSVRAAIRMIEDLIRDDDTVNGEFYLDSLVGRALAEGRNVRALQIPSFVSVGTPTEYETVLYWQSCFHKWALHPYALAADPMVPADARIDLDRRFHVSPSSPAPSL